MKSYSNWVYLIIIFLSFWGCVALDAAYDRALKVYPPAAKSQTVGDEYVIVVPVDKAGTWFEISLNDQTLLFKSMSAEFTIKAVVDYIPPDIPTPVHGSDRRRGI